MTALVACYPPLCYHIAGDKNITYTWIQRNKSITTQCHLSWEAGNKCHRVSELLVFNQLCNLVKSFFKNMLIETCTDPCLTEQKFA